MERNKDLTQTLEIFQAVRNGISSDQVKRVLARIKVDGLGYTLIEGGSECTWYKDSQLVNVQEEKADLYEVCQQVDYAKVFDVIKQLESQVGNCVEQYEERLKRVNDYLE